MFIPDFCSANVSAQKRRHSFNKKRLEVMQFYKDSLERRIAALNASIQTLENQILRDREDQIT